ncbi:hypothetical protein CWB79_22530, partial [Pseudoalteromonas sp. S1649]
FPRPCKTRLKMDGNIIELHNPTSKIAHIAKLPSPIIEINTNKTANKPCHEIPLPALNFFITTQPLKRKTMSPEK